MIRRIREEGIGGFTLLEVMVAMAILGLGLTAIFASQGGSIRAATRARQYTVASFLARCKMAEIEELVASEGLPAIEKHEIDGCCEDAEVDGFECDWRIERVVLPDNSFDEEGEEGEGPLGGALGSIGESGGGAGVVDSLLTGQQGTGGMADMAMSFAFPIMKPAIEEGVRRVTVNITWPQRPDGFDVVQFLVAEPPPVAPETPAP